jgi:FAD binding domain
VIDRTPYTDFERRAHEETVLEGCQLQAIFRVAAINSANSCVSCQPDTDSQVARVFRVLPFYQMSSTSSPPPSAAEIPFNKDVDKENHSHFQHAIQPEPGTEVPSALQVAIIGAGPGGLLLARYLQRNFIHCKIYEKEPSEHHRAQGGSLDLHEHSGQLALKEAGLIEEFWKYARREGEQMKIYDKTGKLWLNSESDNGRPEIDR